MHVGQARRPARSIECGSPSPSPPPPVSTSTNSIRSASSELPPLAPLRVMVLWPSGMSRGMRMGNESRRRPSPRRPTDSFTRTRSPRRARFGQGRVQQHVGVHPAAGANAHARVVDGGRRHVVGVHHAGAVGDVLERREAVEVVVAEADRLLSRLQLHPEAHRHRDRAVVADHVVQALRCAERRDQREVGAVPEPALVGQAGVERDGAAAALAGRDLERDGGRSRAEAAGDGVEGVGGEGALGVAARGRELVAVGPEVGDARAGWRSR